MVFKAIGQSFVPAAVGDGSRRDRWSSSRTGGFAVNEDRQTSLPDVFAGGDCVGAVRPDGCGGAGRQSGGACDRSLCVGGFASTAQADEGLMRAG